MQFTQQLQSNATAEVVIPNQENNDNIMWSVQIASGALVRVSSGRVRNVAMVTAAAAAGDDVVMDVAPAADSVLADAAPSGSGGSGSNRQQFIVSSAVDIRIKDDTAVQEPFAVPVTLVWNATQAQLRARGIPLRRLCLGYINVTTNKWECEVYAYVCVCVRCVVWSVLIDCVVKCRLHCCCVNIMCLRNDCVYITHLLCRIDICSIQMQQRHTLQGARHTLPTLQCCLPETPATATVVAVVLVQALRCGYGLQLVVLC